MVRRRKSLASASKGTPEIDSVVEVITDKDTTMDERELEQSTVIVDTNGVSGSLEDENDTTMDKTESADDVDANDEKNGVKLDAAEAEANEEIVAEGEGVEDHDAKDESGVDGDLADKNDDGGNEVVVDDEEGEEDEEEDEDEEDEEEDEDDDDDEEEEEEEAEKQEDDDHEFGDDIEFKNENQKEDKEENVKVVNDEAQENTVQEEVKEGNTKEEGVNNKEGKRLKKKATPAKNTKAVKKIPGGVSGQEDLKAEHEGGQDDKNVVTEDADGEQAKEKIGGGGGESKKKGKNLRKEKEKGGSKMVSSGREDKPVIPSKKKSSKKVQSMGMVFMCSTKTKKDCYRYKVLGLPASKRETVEKIYKGMRLFLYDLDLKLMYGIYKAAGRGGHNIEPKAFNSKFPSQVKFTVMEDCLPIPEEKFKRVIKDNYFSKNKFDTILTAKQVRDLCKLFNTAKITKHGASEKPSRRVRRPSPVSRHRDRSRGHRDRSRDRDKDFRIVLNDKHRYREYSPYRERAVVIPPPTAAALPYGYDRDLDIDSYRRDQLVERRDRRDPLVERRDSRRLEELLVERRDSRRLEEPLVERRDSYRLEPLVERRDPYRLESLVERRDPYRLEPLVERRDSYRLDPPVVERHDSYKRPALDSGDAYRQVSLSELDDIYRKKPLLDQGSSYRRDEVVPRHVDDYRRLNPLTSYREVRSTGGDDITMLIDRYNSGERAVYRPQVPTTSGLLPEDGGYTTVGGRSTTALLPEYRSVRPRYPY